MENQTSRASNWSMIHIISSGSRDWVSVDSLTSLSSIIIPLSVFGSIISNAPRASRNEKSGARMTSPTANAMHVSYTRCTFIFIPRVAENILFVMSSLRLCPSLVVSDTFNRVISTSIRNSLISRIYLR